MRERIKFVGREDWQDLEHGRHAIIILTTQDGRVLQQEVWHEPMNGNELEEKFDGLVAPKWGKERARRLKEQIRELEHAQSIRPLLQELRV
jgi:hypothetical protein